MFLLAKCKEYGFKDKSDIVRIALERLSTELVQQRLLEFAWLYAEDDDTQEWTDAASSEFV